ncbi:unnamed protein product [Didymodactylos carnosus]|uniref:TIR domain-containing protein n=1 Tax=Didymodactylos carnosus TaxID=1234261 RepID=A0A815S2M5_9BILA|nr:unnamed protein product [Didymodactylos carnosus]CAF4348940.1 unnamed protein product [Didymodactylos carnosus]
MNTITSGQVTSDYVRKIFYSQFDILSSNSMVKYLNNKNVSSDLSTCYETILTIIVLLQKQITEHVTFAKNDLKNQEFILNALAKYIDKFFTEETISSIVSTHSLLLNVDIITIICEFIWAVVDNTIVVPNFINANYHEFVIKWIDIESLSMKHQRPLISIIHNLARHDNGAEVLNKCNAIEVLKKYKKCVLDVNKGAHPDINLLYCMIISLLSDPKENKEDSKNVDKILDKLLQTAIDASLTRNFKANGFHISEPIVVLTKLCVHDDILHYVLNEAKVTKPQTSVIQFFSDTLISFRGALANDDETDQLTCCALFNIVWSISFHDQYVEELKSNTKFLLTVKSLANDDGGSLVDQYVPKHMSSVKKAANGILWNLDENNPARLSQTSTVTVSEQVVCSTELKSNTTDKNNRLLIMISYSHSDVKFCQQLVDSLRKDNQFDIWVDFSYCHTEDLWEEIGCAIEKANVVLFLMTKDYYDSKSCRQEVMYTKDSLKKRFIPIYVQKDFQATGWLGIRVVGPQYIRFGKKSFDETMTELKKLILDDGKSEKKDSEKHSVVPVTEKVETIEKQQTKNIEKELNKSDDYTKKVDEDNDSKITDEMKQQLIAKPISQWSTIDINNWFDQNHIRSELRYLYEFQTGDDLIFYSQSLKPDWQSEYIDIRDRYIKKYNKTLYKDQFVRLVSALDRLTLDYNTAKSNDKKKTSNTCVIV